MWFDYLKERDPELNVLKTAKGFATYRYMDIGIGKAVYIEDIYVIPEFRENNMASELSSSIQKEAKINGCRYLLGTIVPSTYNSNKSLNVLLSHGMTLFKCENDLIWFYMEIQ